MKKDKEALRQEAKTANPPFLLTERGHFSGAMPVRQPDKAATQYGMINDI